jgi:hypothetical protein
MNVHDVCNMNVCGACYMCPNVRPHFSHGEPLEWFSWNFILIVLQKKNIAEAFNMCIVGTVLMTDCVWLHIPILHMHSFTTLWAYVQVTQLKWRPVWFKSCEPKMDIWWSTKIVFSLYFSSSATTEQTFTEMHTLKHPKSWWNTIIYCEKEQLMNFNFTTCRCTRNLLAHIIALLPPPFLCKNKNSNVKISCHTQMHAEWN